MNVGIVTEYFYPTIGGISENVYNFALHLLKRERDFRIITGYRPTPSYVDDEVKHRIIHVGTSVPLSFNHSIGYVSMGLNLSKRMKEILRAEKFDIIHTHSPVFPTLPLIANMQQNAPVVGTFHTCTGGHIYFRVYRKHIMRMLDRMAGRIAVSETCARENQQYFPFRFDIIPNGVDVDWWHTGTDTIKKFNDGIINIIFLGRPDIRNGLDILIRAFRRVKHVYAHTRLIVVGDGPLLKFFKAMVPHDIAHDVHFEGEATILRPRYVRTAHVFCFLPSIASFGITILEGMAAGKAIVASDIEPFRALLSHEQSALLVDPTNERAIADAITRLVGDTALRTRLGHEARHAVWPYSWEHVTERHLEYYETVLGNGQN